MRKKLYFLIGKKDCVIVGHWINIEVTLVTVGSFMFNLVWIY